MNTPPHGRRGKPWRRFSRAVACRSRCSRIQDGTGARRAGGSAYGTSGGSSGWTIGWSGVGARGRCCRAWQIFRPERAPWTRAGIIAVSYRHAERSTRCPRRILPIMVNPPRHDGEDETPALGRSSLGTVQPWGDPGLGRSRPGAILAFPRSPWPDRTDSLTGLIRSSINRSVAAGGQDRRGTGPDQAARCGADLRDL